MRSIIVLLLMLPALALANSAALSTGASCEYAGVAVDAGGRIAVTCTGTSQPPVTPPTQPPPNNPPVGCVAAPPADYEARGALANANTSALHAGTGTRAYSYALPRGASGSYNSGFLQQGDNPGTPTELTVEWAISKCPGDFGYYRSPGAAITPPRGGGAVYPCGGINGAATGAYYWSLAGSSYECKVDNASGWYINVRYLNSCVGDCPVSYYHSEHD